MLGGLLYYGYSYLPEPPAAPPIAITQPDTEPEPMPKITITVLHTLPEFATVLIDLPPQKIYATQIVKTEMKKGFLNIRYGDTNNHIPIFPDVESAILHSEFTDNRLILEVSRL